MTTHATSFRMMDGDALIMVDGSRFLPACAEVPEMLDGLPARVDHEQVWSVLGYAEVVSSVSSASGAACTAWAEIVSNWPEDPQDMFFALRLRRVADCGDHAAIRTVFGDGTDGSTTGLTFLGTALSAAGDQEAACDAFQRAASVNRRATAGNMHDTAEDGVRQACPE